MAPLFEPSAPRHRPGVRTDDRAHAFARDHREVPRRRSSSPRRSTRLSRGNPSWRQRHSTPRSDHCTRREAWSSERDHGERHFGARNPLLRGSAALRQLLARRPLLHAGTPPARPRTSGTRGVCSVRQRVVHRQCWCRSVALPALLERATGEGTLVGDAAGPGREPRVTRYTGCREASQRLHEDASETTLPTEPARVRAEPAGMHRRAVVLTDSSPCKMHPETGDLADLARSTASPRTSSRSSSRETTDAGG